METKGNPGSPKPVTGCLGYMLYKNAYQRGFFTLWGLVIQECRVAFFQFFTIRYPVRSLFHCFGVLYSSLTRLFLGRSLKYSFAHQGEDRVLEGLLKPRIQEPGFYVEVGCNHPKFFSNTYGLYRKGWRGVCIDANPSHIHKFAWYRPQDKAVCALVSEHREVQTFYMLQNDVLSTSKQEFLEEYRQEGLAIKEISMEGRTLTEILENAGAPNKFELLAVDAEEQDLEVLRSLDWGRYRPRWVIVEDETYGIGMERGNSICQWMEGKGYRLEGFVLKNLYFKDGGG